MRREMFVDGASGVLVPIRGVDPRRGAWSHIAFLPDPLSDDTPALAPRTFNAVASCRAALAALDARASLLPNPALLRRSTLRIEAQSTSALEGTYAPLVDVLAADEQRVQSNADMREVLNYVIAAEYAFAWIGDARPMTLGIMEDLQGRLVRHTRADTDQAGRVRTVQVVIGSNPGAPIEDARFVPPPPGLELETLARDWVRWIGDDHGGRIDPVVAAAMGHYQFETLHPFNDGNGRIGRLAIVLQLHVTGVLTEPTLSVSPWFEARRDEYYDRLMAVSTHGDWDGWVRFFADGLAESASATRNKIDRLIQIANDLKATVRASDLRADTAISLVDFALERTVFSVRDVEGFLELSYGRANKLVGQLVAAGVLEQIGAGNYGRRFAAPAIMAVLTSRP